MPQWGQASFEQVDIASASSLNLSAVVATKVRITAGAATINTITMKPFQFLFVTFVGALTILSTAASLPNGGANIAVEAGDRMTIMADGAGFGTVWDYQRASGTALQAGISGLTLTGGTLAITVDTNRTLAINGNVSLNDWFDQSVKTTASPTFAGITVNGTIVLGQGGDDAIALTGAAVNVVGPLQVTATNTNGLIVGRDTTFPAFWVDTGGSSSFTVGLKVAAATSGAGGVVVSVNSVGGGDNEGLTIQAKNAGVLALGGGTNTISIERPTNITNAMTVNHTSFPLRVTTTQNVASAPVAILEGDRASSANGDIAYLALMLSREAAGAQFEFCRMSWAAVDAGVGTEVGGMYFHMANAGTLGARYLMLSASFSPFASGGASLGLTTTPWSNLYLSSTGTINFGNGNVVLTHSTGNLGMTSAAPTFYVGAADTQRSSLTQNGLTMRRDQAGINDSLYLENLGIAAASQGATVRYRFQGSAGVAAVAAEMATLSTEDWNGDANKSAKYRFNTLTNNVLGVSLDILELGIHVAPSKNLVAGGDVTEYIKIGASGQGIYVGSGAPTISAAKGSIYLRSDGGGTASRLYVNTDGGTTWTNLTAAA